MPAERPVRTDGTTVVTGANRGVGRATAEGLARSGAHVVLVCRDPDRGEEALQTIRRESAGEVDLVLADFSSLESVRACATEILDRFPGVRVLVNNAGVVCRSRSTTVDGFETTFAVNHLAPFLLTHLLRGKLEENAPARVVTVASEAHRQSHLDLDDLQTERRWHGLRAYGRSKLANVLFSAELARRLEGTGVTSNSLHPGAVRTGLMEDFCATIPVLRHFIPLARRLAITPRRGARTSIWLADSPEVDGTSGGYFIRCRPVRPSPEARDEALARELWKRSAVLARLGGRG